MPTRRAITVLFVLLCATLLSPSALAAGLVKIGVYSPEGFEHGMHRWQPTAAYLQSRIPASRFQMLPYQKLAELEQDARQGKFDFVLTHPGSFVRLEQQAGLIRLATRLQQEQGQRHGHAAMVLFTRADNRQLQHLDNLPRVPVITTFAQDYSGWQLLRLELLRRQRDPDAVFSRVDFAGDAAGVLRGVMAGEYPAGAMAAQDFDRFLRQGRISPQAIRILDARQDPAFPFRYTGRLYPQWPLGALPDTPGSLRNAVLQALLSMPDDHPALQSGRYAGWQPPERYQAVRPLLNKSLTQHVVERQVSVANLWLAQNRRGLLITLAFTLGVWLLIRLFGHPRRFSRI